MMRTMVDNDTVTVWLDDAHDTVISVRLWPEDRKGPQYRVSVNDDRPEQRTRVIEGPRLPRLDEDPG